MNVAAPKNAFRFACQNWRGHHRAGWRQTLPLWRSPRPAPPETIPPPASRPTPDEVSARHPARGANILLQPAGEPARNFLRRLFPQRQRSAEQNSLVNAAEFAAPKIFSRRENGFVQSNPVCGSAARLRPRRQRQQQKDNYLFHRVHFCAKFTAIWQSQRLAAAGRAVEFRIAAPPKSRFHRACQKSSTFLKYWLPAVLWMILIFSASADTHSYQHSFSLFVPLLHWLFP